MQPTRPDPAPGVDEIDSGPDPTVATADPRRRPALGWLELVVAAVAYLLLSIVVVVLLLVAAGGTLPTVPLVALTGVATLGAVALAVALRVRSGAAVGLRPATWRWLLIGLGAGVGCWLVNRFVIIGYVALTGDTGNPQQQLTDSAAGPGLELVGLLLAGAVLIPFAEELLFRGVGYGALRRYGVVAATMFSALLFGLAHGISVVLPAAIILGLVNAVLYERAQSIWPAVVAHGVNNAIIFTTVAILY